MYVLQTNCWEEYNEYIEVTTQKDHSQHIFEHLRDTFDIAKVEPIDVWWDGKYFIVDNGVHRLALLKYFGHITDRFPLRLLNIRIPEDVQTQIGNVLQGTVGGNLLYNGWHNRTSYGYHSFNIGTMSFVGQRNPVKRLEKMRKVYSFAGKKVLDLGSNTGGMLFHCFEMDSGVGLEYDERCVKGAKEIASRLGFLPQTTFDVCNLDTDSVKEKLPKEWKPDCILLLSMGSWLKSWRAVYQQALDLKPEAIWLETNNVQEGQAQLAFFGATDWLIEKISNQSEDDSTGNYGRSLYFIRRIVEE